MTTEEPLLRVDGLVKRFGGLRALNGCSLSVRWGSITGLIGPNGAGKTTLFNVVSGFLTADAGRVWFRGEDVTNMPPHQLFRRGMCRTFQLPREHKKMTVLENLMLVPAGQVGECLWNVWLRPAAIRRQEEEVREKALEVLRLVDLFHLANEYAGNLSGGQKKLLELARTLMADPQLVLLDEPAAGVNPSLMGRLRDRIEQLNRERGITFLLIEHDMGLVMDLCDPVIVMSEGALLAEGPPAAIRRDPRVLEAYLGGQHASLES